ncbi:S-layer homology domain-containing protein [Dermabacteraceae bacterium P7074]
MSKPQVRKSVFGGGQPPLKKARQACSLGLAGVLTAALAVTLPAPAAQADETPEALPAVQLAKGRDGVFPNYRIPAIIRLNNGDLLASYDGRPTGIDAPGPNSILQRRSTDGGRTWGEQTVVAAGRGGADKIGYSDPSYVYDAETNTLFNFHVFSKDTGFWNSGHGNDDADRKVMSASVSVSTDGGHTWKARSVTEIVKPEGVRATFASSGHGIQLTRGAHKGRLILQYAGQWRDGSVRAYSVYSDDHGETWQMGKPIGTNMDENKVVELSDGTLMLNSRMHSGGKARYVARSTDGGQTWSGVETDHTLTDPRNNASIIAMYPGAEAGSKQARELLFSNANSSGGRNNGSIRYSCDDGQTWPVVKTYRPGSHSYSDLVALGDNKWGSLFEGEGNRMLFSTFDKQWLKPFCANFAPVSATANAGEQATLSVTLRNDDDRTLPAGTAVAAFPGGWESQSVPTPELAPGKSATVEVPVTVGLSAQTGTVRGEVRVSAGEMNLRGDAEVNVAKGAAPTIAGQITGKRADSERDVASDPYTVGEKVPYSFRITNSGNTAATFSPSEGDFNPLLPPNRGNCRWRGLAAGQAYSCASPRHTVTEADLADGFFNADTVWTLSADGFADVRLEVPGGEVDLRERKPAVSVERTLTVAGQPVGEQLEVGQRVSITEKVTNTGNVRLTGVAGAVEADELAAGKSVENTREHEVTEEDAKAGKIVLEAPRVTANNGSRAVEANGEAVTLKVRAPEVAEELSFSDVNEKTAFYDEIMWLARTGVTTGYSDGTFRPGEAVNRDAMAAYLYRLAGSPRVTPPRSQPFRDVRPDTEHYDAIIWAHQNGITRGYPDRTFRPTAPIGRDAMAAFLYRYAGSPELEMPTAAPFEDVSLSHPFVREIAWMKEQGLSTGWPDGTYRPTSSTNRDATAAFLYRAKEKAGIEYLSEKDR